MSVLVFIEVNEKVSKAALEVVSYGSKIGPTTVVTFGNTDEDSLKVTTVVGPILLPYETTSKAAFDTFSFTSINTSTDILNYFSFVM
jgi:hypothetical protein